MIRFCYTGGTFDSEGLLMSSGSADLCTFDSTLTTFDSTVRTFDATTCVEQTPETPTVFVAGAGVDVPTWREAVQQKFNELNAELKEEVREEKKLARQIKAAKKKVEASKHPEGLLANLHMLEHKRETTRREIKDLRLQIEWAKLEFQVDDEDDEEILLLQ
jgi:hypothetical protein